MKIYNLSNKELFINQQTILRKSWWCWDVFLCWLWFCCHLLDIWIGKFDFWNSLMRFLISIFRWWNALSVHYAVIMKNFIVCDSLEVSSFSMLYSNVVIAIRRTKNLLAPRAKINWNISKECFISSLHTRRQEYYCCNQHIMKSIINGCWLLNRSILTKVIKVQLWHALRGDLKENYES